MLTTGKLSSQSFYITTIGVFDGSGVVNIYGTQVILVFKSSIYPGAHTHDDLMSVRLAAKLQEVQFDGDIEQIRQIGLHDKQSYSD